MNAYSRFRSSLLGKAILGTVLLDPYIFFPIGLIQNRPRNGVRMCLPRVATHGLFIHFIAHTGPEKAERFFFVVKARSVDPQRVTAGGGFHLLRVQLDPIDTFCHLRSVLAFSSKRKDVRMYGLPSRVKNVSEYRSRTRNNRDENRWGCRDAGW